MALGQLAPWLNINTQEWGNLAARGAQLDIERARLAQEAQERKAADALQRDRFQLDTQNAQTRNDQLAAGMALNIAKLKQSGLMGQERIGQGQERIDQSGQTAAAKLAETTNRDANTNQNQQDRNQILANGQTLRQQIEAARNSKTATPADKTQLDVFAKSLEDANHTLLTQTDPTVIKNINAQIQKLQQDAQPLLDRNSQPSAASTLTQGTGTNLPSAPAAPAPSPNLPANPAATSLSAPGNYSAPQFQAKLPGASKGNPSPDDIAYLRANPKLAAKFDARFGAGLAAQILAQ